MPNLKGWEWLIIVALILLLFGAKRLPDAARGLGRSMRIFKAETKGLVDDAKGAAADADTPSATAPAIPPATPPAVEAAHPTPPAADAPPKPNPVSTERAEG